MKLKAECYGIFAQYRFRCVLGELGRFREGTGFRDTFQFVGHESNLPGGLLLVVVVVVVARESISIKHHTTIDCQRRDTCAEVSNRLSTGRKNGEIGR